MVNLDQLHHQEDVKCDNLGSWRNNGTKNRTYEMNEDGYPELLDEEEAREATDTYTLRRVYYKNKATPDLKKYVMSLKGNVITNESSKRHSKLLPLIFTLKCLSKPPICY